MEKFSIKESLRFAWDKFKMNAELSLGATLLVLAVSFFMGSEKHGNGWGILTLAVMVISLIIRIGYTKIFLRIYDNEAPKFMEIFEEYRTFWKYLGVSILYFLATVGGLLLLIIPGIIWAVRFSFSPLIVVDTKIRPVSAMKESYAITKGSFWKLLLFWICLIAINIVGMIFFGLGLLVTVPISTLATVYVYRELTKARAGVGPRTESVPTISQV